MSSPTNRRHFVCRTFSDPYATLPARRHLISAIVHIFIFEMQMSTYVQMSTPSRTALHHVADLPDLYTACTGSVPAGITHSCTCHTCITTFPKPSCMHSYIYTCGFSNAQLRLHDQLHACMRMPYMHRSHIDFITHSLFGRAERYYLHSGACAFS